MWAVGTHSGSKSDVRARARLKHYESVGPCTSHQGSLGSRGACNAGESNQGKFILIPCPSRAREVVTQRGALTDTEFRS